MKPGNHKEDSSACGRDKAPQAPIDFKEAILEFEGDREIFFSILNKFLQNAKNQVDIMRQALFARDAERLKIEAHSVKGGAANLTAVALAAGAAALEEIARSGQWEKAPGLFERFKEELQRLEKYVEGYLKDQPEG